jgi:RNA polymerase sigma factor (sigma-70 family)
MYTAFVVFSGKINSKSELSLAEETDLERILEKEEKLKLAASVVSDLGAKCQEILKLFYYRSLKMKEIAEKLGFRSEKIARNQKYKCLERAKLKLKEKLA